MTDQPSTDPATALPDPVHPRCWTPQRQRVFLLALHRSRNVSVAAAAAGMSRQSAYRLLHRSAGGAFARAWQAALDPRSLPPPDPRPHPHAAAARAGLHKVTPGYAG